MLIPKMFVVLAAFLLLCQLGIYHGLAAYYAEGSIEFYASENYKGKQALKNNYKMI